MSQYFDKLITQTYKHLPQFSKCLQHIPPNKFYINYPLQLTQQKHKSIFPNSSTYLKSQKTINPNNHIFFIQSNQFFASSSFAGATNHQQQNLSTKLDQLKSKYQIFDDDMINRIKLTLSVQANLLDQSLHLNTYAKYILKQKKSSSIQNYIKMHANSGFLKSVLNSNKLAITTAYEYLNKTFMQAVKYDDFSNAYEFVRFYSKQTNKLRVIFPYCKNIKHSFNPNCEIRAMFLTHRRQTFLSLDSIKQISPGQTLTINYGNQNNYQMFVRYGFALADNPFSEFYLPLDFSQIQDIFNANMEWKMQMFKKNKKFKLKNFIRIDAQGNINSQDLNMLKIIFSVNPLNRETFNSQSQECKQLLRQINEFVRKTAMRFNVMLQKMIQKKRQLNRDEIKGPQNQTQQAMLHNINIIQADQKKILKLLTTKQ